MKKQPTYEERYNEIHALWEMLVKFDEARRTKYSEGEIHKITKRCKEIIHELPDKEGKSNKKREEEDKLIMEFAEIEDNFYTLLKKRTKTPWKDMTPILLNTGDR